MSNWSHRAAIPGGRRLRLGVAGPSRSGKTLSSLRIASGMASIIKKPIFFIDTDNEFALDYAGKFSFEHVDFKPPYTSERYREAIEYCVSQDAGIIIVDQITHEHTGDGGLLQRQEKLAGDLAAKWNTSREKTNMAAWSQAKGPHQDFVSYVTRVKQPIIFNFRAKDKIKLLNKGGKQEIVHVGYSPICTEQFDFEMTAMLMLPPNSNGIPDKDLSEVRDPLREVIRLGQQIDEALGVRLAQWAAGGSSEPRFDAEPYRKALKGADSLEALQAALEAAWKATSKGMAVREVFTADYEARKTELSATGGSPEPEEI